MNPLKMMLEASPDRKIVWFLLLTGVAKMFGLDEYVRPEHVDTAVTVVEYANKEVQEVANQIRQLALENQGNDTNYTVAVLTYLAGIVYTIGKKAKEWKATKEEA